MEVSCQPHDPAALPIAKQDSVLIKLDISGPQSRHGRFGKEQHFLPLPGPYNT
jgi:hypothetical protein